MHATGTISQEQSSYKGFLILHGTVWLALVAGLATNKLWSYRAAIAVFTGFAIFRFTGSSSKILIPGIVTCLIGY